MARPRKNEEEKRNRRVIVRLTAKERARLRVFAKQAGLSVSDYVRSMAFTGRVRMLPQRRSHYGDYLADQLRRVGVNLNQLTRVANTDGELPPELAGVCHQLEKLLDRIIRMD